MDTEHVAMHLDLIAAQAKLAANNVRQGKYWPGELTAAIVSISQSLRAISYTAQEDR